MIFCSSTNSTANCLAEMQKPLDSPLPLLTMPLLQDEMFCWTLLLTVSD